MKLRPLKHFCIGPPEYGLNVPASEYTGSGLRFLRTTDIGAGGGLDQAANEVFVQPATIESRHELLDGDLLFSRSGSLGRCLRYDDHTVGPATYAGYLVRFRPRPDVDARYIEYCSRASFFQAAIEADAITSTISNFNAERYATLRLPWWPLTQQQAIADFLDTETARIDALIAKKRRMIELLREQQDRRLDRTALPHSLPDSRVSPLDVPLEADTPPSWAVLPIGLLLTRITYGFTNPMPTSELGPFMLTANDIGEGVINYESARRTTDEAFGALLTDKSRPVTGDVLLTKDGSLGRVALFDGNPSCVNQSVAVLSPDRSRILPELLAELLMVPAYRDALVFAAGGTTIRHLYITRVVKQRLAVPPAPAQALLAESLREIRETLRRHVRLVQRSIDLLTERRQALITAAVTGELDVGVAA